VRFQDLGSVSMRGIDALVRLTMDQVRTDARRGLKTGMFVSGYRGSPVGMLDANFIKQQKLLLQHNIHFVDGINEDLAATAVWGTQMLHTVGKQKFDGVTGMWYGKAPGVDRSGDALKHANYTGIGKNGGVLAVVGDDPSCKSPRCARASPSRCCSTSASPRCTRATCRTSSTSACMATTCRACRACGRA
jgi:indolepyruvate ferredoxin oxidoreductase